MNYASLSPSLLARKGGAKPAMRRQSPMIDGTMHGAQAHDPEPPDALEDLGWNDLGDAPEGTAQSAGGSTSSAGAITPQAEDAGAPGAESQEAEDNFAPLGRHATSISNPSSATAVDESEPESAALHNEFENVTPINTKAPRLPRPRPVETARPQPKAKRTAFTLRLDQERHLKLRMACTLAGRSAQALVTEALDAMLADIPELDQFVARVQSRQTREG